MLEKELVQMGGPKSLCRDSPWVLGKGEAALHRARLHKAQ